MQPNELPKMNMDKSETKCCPKFDPTGWDGQTIVFDNKLFAKTKTRSFMHFPLGLDKMYKNICKKIEDEKAGNDEQFLVLSYDPSPWKGEHYFAVEKDVSSEEMVKLSGTYITKVFEGPFKDVGKFVKEMEEFVVSKDEKMKKLYFFYTTCPRCLKHWGKNFIVAFGEI
ncbi:hypothetical protein KJ641_02710 [Patescibacteria group bacterium]|nr:hypothetical protein [Patescibacteria group bacterium]MBU1895756.1 hypothetical protein [Patescibacteria group bacterium]